MRFFVFVVVFAAAFLLLTLVALLLLPVEVSNWWAFAIGAVGALLALVGAEAVDRLSDRFSRSLMTPSRPPTLDPQDPAGSALRQASELFRYHRRRTDGPSAFPKAPFSIRFTCRECGAVHDLDGKDADDVLGPTGHPCPKCGHLLRIETVP